MYLEEQIIPFKQEADNRKAGSLHRKRSSQAAVPCTRRALAAAYFPDTCPVEAVRRLRRWIQRCTPLYSRLTQDGTPFDGRKLLTVREVRLIMEYLGEPGEDP